MSDAEPEVSPRQADEKWHAYPDTILEFESRPPLRVDLRENVADDARMRLGSLGLAMPFGVFTAENPAGDNAEDEPSPGAEERKERANDRREGRLEHELRERGVAYVRVDGVSPDGRYREHCVATLVTREAAVALARRYRQLALFWYDGSAFWLLPALADEQPQRLPRNERSA